MGVDTNIHVLMLPDYFYKALNGKRQPNLETFTRVVFGNVSHTGDKDEVEYFMSPTYEAAQEKEVKDFAKWLVTNFSKNDIRDLVISNTFILESLFNPTVEANNGFSNLCVELTNHGIVYDYGMVGSKNNPHVHDFLNMYMSNKEDSLEVTVDNNMRMYNNKTSSSCFSFYVTENTVFVVPQSPFGDSFLRDFNNLKKQFASEVLDLMVAHYGEDRAIKTTVFKLWTELA